MASRQDQAQEARIEGAKPDRHGAGEQTKPRDMAVTDRRPIPSGWHVVLDAKDSGDCTFLCAAYVLAGGLLSYADECRLRKEHFRLLPDSIVIKTWENEEPARKKKWIEQGDVPEHPGVNDLRAFMSRPWQPGFSPCWPHNDVGLLSEVPRLDDYGVCTGRDGKYIDGRLWGNGMVLYTVNSHTYVLKRNF